MSLRCDYYHTLYTSFSVRFTRSFEVAMSPVTPRGSYYIQGLTKCQSWPPDAGGGGRLGMDTSSVVGMLGFSLAGLTNKTRKDLGKMIERMKISQPRALISLWTLIYRTAPVSYRADEAGIQPVSTSVQKCWRTGRMYYDHTLGADLDQSDILKACHGELHETQIRTGLNKARKGTYLRICGCMGFHGEKMKLGGRYPRGCVLLLWFE